MDRYDTILRNARCGYELPAELEERLNQYHEEHMAKGDVEKYKKEELVRDLVVFLWETNRIDWIKEFSELFEPENDEEKNYLKELLELEVEFEKKTTSYEKNYIRAKGFCVLYEFDIALEIMGECLMCQDISIDAEKIIRKHMQEIYDNVDVGTEKERNDNTIRLIKLRGFDRVECKNYLRYCLFNPSLEEMDFVIEILSKYEEIEFWNILFKNNYRNDESLSIIYEKVQPNIALEEEIYLEVLKTWFKQKKYEKIHKEIIKIRNLLMNIEQIDCFEVKLLIEEKITKKQRKK